MLDCKNTQSFSIFIYNFRLVTITVIGEQLSIHDKLYVKDDIVKIPMWLAKLYYKNNHCTIQEFEDMEGVLNTVISNQQVAKQEIVPIEQDFYLLVNDYFNFYMKYKIKYLEFDDSISENDKSEKEMEIRMTINKQRNKFKKFVDMRKKLLLLNGYLGYNRSLIKNMAFQECIIYNNVCETMKSFDDNFNCGI